MMTRLQAKRAMIPQLVCFIQPAAAAAAVLLLHAFTCTRWAGGGGEWQSIAIFST